MRHARENPEQYAGYKPVDPIPQVEEKDDDFCDDCGEHTEDGVSCPDGSFICRDCFNAGRH